MVAIGAISGTILPMTWINAQNTAENYGTPRGYLDSAKHIAMMQAVGGLSPKAVFANEHRYPSPDERLLTYSWEPFFFLALSILWRDRRGFAQNRALPLIDFDSDHGMAPSCGPNTFVEKGTTSCDASPWRSRFFWFSPLAVRRLWSKPSLAPARALALRRSSMATLPRGRPSARRATCSIVRRTPAAADIHHRIIAAPGLTAWIAAPRPLTKRGPCLRVGAALSAFPIADRRNDRCSRRS